MDVLSKLGAEVRGTVAAVQARLDGEPADSESWTVSARQLRQAANASERIAKALAALEGKRDGSISLDCLKERP